MTPTSIASLICTVLALVAPYLTGHVPSSAVQWIVSIASVVAIVASHVVTTFQPSQSQLAAKAVQS
jgi:hypothetical protein